MWGVRAIRVGLLSAGLLAIVAGAGCCECGPFVRKGDAPPASLPAQAVYPDIDENGLRRVQGEWKRGGGWFKDQPQHLTPEKIEGGIL